ncbi:hypothetical protein C9374_004621 [Naegleria lovaniensis]|uniref:Uncharacterized protein n=1 Tax=Naegleria lovaniensis TaxID=51637 RepID=A0AA88KIW4_NAELO|nr:uncharacterized protein C9374_004621 [Naegleria lovaniensis]KAG2383284.1 hypothetical protein C9374_004621 [Naegleria lovaniensis]
MSQRNSSRQPSSAEKEWLLVGHQWISPLWYETIWSIIEGVLTLILYPLCLFVGLASFVFYHLFKKKGKELFKFNANPYHGYDTIFLNGASSGIGKSIALELARNFAKRKNQKKFTLVISGRKQQALEEVRQQCLDIIKKESNHPEEDYEILIRLCDVTDAEKVKEYLSEFDFDLKYTSLEKLKVDFKCWDTNMTGCTNVVFPALEKMMEQNEKGNSKRRHIVLTSSGTGYFPELGLYPIAKAALINMGRFLRAKLDNSHTHNNIRVSVFVPGWVSTNMADKFPQKGAQVGMISSEEAARLACSGIEHDLEIIDICGFWGVVLRVLLKFPYTLGSPLIRMMV